MSAGAAGAVVRQGHLRKLKTMKKKYFVLRAEGGDCSARLEYYESEKKFRAGAAARRVLPLKGCYNITRRLDLKQRHVIALFTREEQFCVVADNEADLHAWLAALLRLHSEHEHSDELLHPIQHVWQVNVQKKGLGASKNIQGLYNLCLTDKTLALVKIKSHNNIISDLGIPERIEYSLKNIRRCGDSECFFYMEVGRQTATGAGELWMHSEDSNIAQSMHSTIYHAMRNCAKETENERDHVAMPKDGAHPLPARRQTYSDGRGRAGLADEKSMCVGSCIKQCVCSTTTYSIDDSAAAIAPLTPTNAENHPPNNSLIPDKADGRPAKHHRTVSLPTGCPSLEPLRVCHERTRSAPLTGDEVDRATAERAARHSSCKTINGTDKKPQWSRRASTGARLSKLSPAHTKNAAGAFRNRCDSMPSRACSSLEAERPPARHAELGGADLSRDETDTIAEWHRTPRIPEEPDYCEMGPRELFTKQARGGARTWSEPGAGGAGAGGADGYLPMAPLERGPVSASSGSVASGTPSTDPRFSEYQLEPATAHIAAAEAEERPPRAYSVGSRPAPPRADLTRLRAYSVGAAARGGAAWRGARAASSAPLLPRAGADDLMELDFSHPPHKVPVSRTPPSGGVERAPRSRDADTDSAGYVEMRPAAGYVDMCLGARTPVRAAAGAAPEPQCPLPLEEAGAEAPRPAPAPEPTPEPEHHALATLREISEEGGRKSPELSSSPAYVALVPADPALKPLASASGLHYAALDLQPRAPAAPAAPRLYSQIDWRRSDKLRQADN